MTRALNRNEPSSGKMRAIGTRKAAGEVDVGEFLLIKAGF
jgi:hypothetical protein